MNDPDRKRNSTGQEVPDDWTLKLEKLLLEVAATAEKEGKKYFLGCGFGLDVLQGRLTRSHEDLDIFPMEEDTQWWKDWFSSRGYIISKEPDMKDFPYAFLLTNQKHDYLVDVYPVKVSKDGVIIVTSTNEYKGRLWWQGKNWDEVRKVFYKGIPIYVENPQTIIAQKLGHVSFHNEPLAGKHLHDFNLFRNSSDHFSS